MPLALGSGFPGFRTGLPTLDLGPQRAQEALDGFGGHVALGKLPSSEPRRWRALVAVDRGTMGGTQGARQLAVALGAARVSWPTKRELGVWWDRSFTGGAEWSNGASWWKWLLWVPQWREQILYFQHFRCVD